jgi:hypothetical protein
VCKCSYFVLKIYTDVDTSSSVTVAVTREETGQMWRSVYAMALEPQVWRGSDPACELRSRLLWLGEGPEGLGAREGWLGEHPSGGTSMRSG